MGIYSKEFERIIINETLGSLTREEYDEIFRILSNEFSEKTSIPSIEANLIRLFRSLFSLSRFLKDCITYPHFLPIIINIVSNSNYLTDILVRDPEYLYWILSSGKQNKRLDKSSISTEIKKRFSNTTTFNGRIRILKAIKRKEILKIGFRDICQIDDISQTTLQLSILAKTILSYLFEICIEKKLFELNSSKLSPQYSLIALGKLGGNELNYSSDVDLILFYKEGMNYHETINYSEFLSSVIQLFIRESTLLDDEGYLYRIDFRLRPYGKDSPLCKSLEQTINYYEYEGEEWERQMLIKVSYLCGSKKLFNDFYSFINSFIYSRNIKSPIEQILRLRKLNIDKQSDDFDIKQSAGGLRDIEFPIQGLQLIYGSMNPSIRTGNTLLAISELHIANILSYEEKTFLSESYILFRRIEHYLQLMNDNQTHRIPKSGILLDKLVNFFGFLEYNSFLHEIKHRMENIRKFAASVYLDSNIPTDIKNIFNKPVKWKREKEFLSEGKGLSGRKKFDTQMTESFERIEEYLDNFLNNSKNPDMTIRNFVRIIKSANFPSIWYDLLLDKSLFKYLLTICERSQKAIDLFAENKKLRDFFISGGAFNSVERKYFPLFSTEELLFTLLSKYANNLITGFEAGNILSDYLKKRIKNYFENTQKLNGKYDGILVLGLGSFSTGEMTFNSDIDLIFISNTANSLYLNDIHEILLKNISELQHILGPIKIDSRLRPEGESGSIIWSRKSFNSYLKTRARSWEFQSYTKMNLIYGDKRSYSTIHQSIINAISLRDKRTLLKSSLDIMEKSIPQGISFNIKNSRGGLRESEYFSQILLLNNQNAFIELSGKKVQDILQGIHKYFPEYSNEAKILLRNRKYLINLQLTLQTLFGGTGSIMPTDNEKLTLVSKLIGFSDKQVLLKRIETIRKENTLVFKNIIEKLNCKIK